jgi:hypothetical protein
MERKKEIVKFCDVVEYNFIRYSKSERRWVGKTSPGAGAVECHMVKTKGITFVCRLSTIELDRVLSLEKQIELDGICFFFLLLLSPV